MCGSVMGLPLRLRRFAPRTDVIMRVSIIRTPAAHAMAKQAGRVSAFDFGDGDMWGDWRLEVGDDNVGAAGVWGNVVVGVERAADVDW